LRGWCFWGWQCRDAAKWKGVKGMKIDKFDYNDFEANPKKYTMFKTARIANSVFTVNGNNDLEAGRVVGIKYIGSKFNDLYRRIVPIYQCDTGHILDGYALGDFVL
jgi:hypothetical protein